MKTSFVLLAAFAAVVVRSGFAADYVGALDAVYQWSVEVPRVEQGKPNSRAFLWIPEKCRELKGVVLGSDNMLEEPIFANANFREGAATVDSDTGKVTFLPLPPKAKRPHRVTLVEWTWGGDVREIVMEYQRQ